MKPFSNLSDGSKSTQLGAAKKAKPKATPATKRKAPFSPPAYAHKPIVRGSMHRGSKKP